MRDGLRAALALVLTCGFAAAQSGPQSSAAKTNSAAPTPSGDLSGVWMLQSRGPMRSISKTPPPMTPAGQAKFQANKPGFGPRAVPGGNDPIGTCDPLGIPRALLSPRAFQFVQLPNRMLMFFESYRTWRDIWMDGRPLPADPPVARFFGYSVGKWQGDTFVVDSTGFDERSWTDALGDPHSDAMHLQERYRRVDHNTLEVTMTLEDPKIYTKPWVSDKFIWKLQPDQALDEDFCVGSEELSYNQRMRDPAAGK